MKLFVWDFHGVLEKDNELAVLDISNRVLEQAGYTERLSAKDSQEYYGLKWYQYFERLLPNLSTDQHMALQAACFRFAEQNLHILADHIRPNDHAHEILEAIELAGHDQIIVSNTRQQDLLWFVQAIGIEQYFPEEKVFGVNAHQTHSAKKDALQKYLATKPDTSIVIVGDSAGDMELKEVQGGTTYFYTHPHLTPSTQKSAADFYISDLRAMLREL